MKKIFTFIVILTVSLNMQAQEKMYIWQNGVKTSFVVAEVDSITFEKENTPLLRLQQEPRMVMNGWIWD